MNELLSALLVEVQAVLGQQFVGLYLYGSLAVGDFNSQSDVDFVAATTDALFEEMVMALIDPISTSELRQAIIDLLVKRVLALIRYVAEVVNRKSGRSG